MAEIIVSLKTGKAPQADRREQVRILKERSSAARTKFLDWLKEQDPHAEVLPREDTGSIAPVLKVTTRPDVVSKLWSREERPDMVAAVDSPFEVRIPEPQSSDDL